MPLVTFKFYLTPIESIFWNISKEWDYQSGKSWDIAIRGQKQYYLLGNPPLDARRHLKLTQASICYYMPYVS